MKRLIEQLKSSDEICADVAVKRLIGRRDPACVPLLLPLALSPDIYKQSRATMVLSHFIPTQHAAIWSFMHPRLLRGSKATKAKVLLALEDLPVAEAAPLLKRFALRSGDPELRGGALGCLLSIARTHPRLRPGLRAIFLKAARSRTGFIRFPGFSGLNDFQDSRYDSILLESVNDPDPGIRAYSFIYAESVAARKRIAASKNRRS